MQYSFDEANGEKGVKVFDLTAKGVENLRDVALKSGRRLVRLEAESPTQAEELLFLYPDALAEMRLHLSSPLTSAEAAALSAHENLASLIAEVNETGTLEFESRKGFSDSRLFEAVSYTHLKPAGYVVARRDSSRGIWEYVKRR